MSVTQITGNACYYNAGSYSYMVQPLFWFDENTPSTFDDSCWSLIANGGMNFIEYSMNVDIGATQYIDRGDGYQEGTSFFFNNWGSQGASYTLNLWNKRGKDAVTLRNMSSNSRIKIATGHRDYNASELIVTGSQFSSHLCTKLKANLSNCTATYQVIAKPTDNDWTTINTSIAAGDTAWYGCTIRATFTYSNGYTGPATKDFVLGDGDARVITHAGVRSYTPVKICVDGWKNAEVYIYNDGWKLVKPYVYNDGWRELNG